MKHGFSFFLSLYCLTIFVSGCFESNRHYEYDKTSVCGRWNISTKHSDSPTSVILTNLSSSISLQKDNSFFAKNLPVGRDWDSDINGYSSVALLDVVGEWSLQKRDQIYFISLDFEKTEIINGKMCAGINLFVDKMCGSISLHYLLTNHEVFFEKQK